MAATSPDDKRPPPTNKAKLETNAYKRAVDVVSEADKKARQAEAVTPGKKRMQGVQ